MSRVRQSALLATLLFLVAALPAEAFRMLQNTSTGRVSAGFEVECDDPGGFAHWENFDIPFYLNTSGQGSGKASAISSALAAWTNVSGASHTLSYAGTTSAGWSTDGQNTVLFSLGNGCTGGCLALTALVLQSGQVIVEADVTFNTAKSWYTSGAQYDTRAVATHEFGHALGIHHTELTSTPRPTMYVAYFGPGGRSLEADDRAALRCAEDRYPNQVPATPASMSVQPDFCFGLVFLNWSAASGAVVYEVQRSTTSSFGSADTIYIGPSTSLSGHFTHNSSNPTHYRVRACNNVGCSAWRYGGSATYTNCP